MWWRKTAQGWRRDVPQAMGHTSQSAQSFEQPSYAAAPPETGTFEGVGLDGTVADTKIMQAAQGSKLGP